MLRRFCQQSTSSALTAATTSFGQLAARATYAPIQSPSQVYQMSARTFIKIRMAKSANQYEEGQTEASTATAADSTPQTSNSMNTSEGSSDYDIQWDSTDFYKRLGLNKKCTDKEIRARYIELAKRFHPDLASAKDNVHMNNLPPNVKPDDVFKNIKEAYEALNNPQTRAYIDARGSEEYQERQQQGYGVSPEEFARQQAVRQLFTDGLPFFLASVALFVGIVAYHYRARLNTGTLFYFVFILMVLGAFPRLLAAALMYMMHCNDMLTVYEAESQAAALISVTARQSSSSAFTKKGDGSSGVPMEVTIRAEGLDPRHVPEGNLVVEIQPHQTSSEASVPKASSQEDNSQAETFVFAKGITAVTIPLVLPNVPASGIPTLAWDLHVRFINDPLQLTLMDKKASL